MTIQGYIIEQVNTIGNGGTREKKSQKYPPDRLKR